MRVQLLHGYFALTILSFLFFHAMSQCKQKFDASRKSRSKTDIKYLHGHGMCAPTLPASGWWLWIFFSPFLFSVRDQKQKYYIPRPVPCHTKMPGDGSLCAGCKFHTRRSCFVTSTKVLFLFYFGPQRPCKLTSSHVFASICSYAFRFRLGNRTEKIADGRNTTARTMCMCFVYAEWMLRAIFGLPDTAAGAHASNGFTSLDW